MPTKYLFLQYVAGPGLEKMSEREFKDFSRISKLGGEHRFLFEENIVCAKIVVCTRCYENIVSFTSSFSFLKE